MPDLTWPPMKPSNLYFNLSLPVQELDRLISQEVEKSLSQGLNLDDGYRIEIGLEDHLHFSVHDFEVFYNTPLRLKIFPFKSTKLFAEGSINLDFNTALNVEHGILTTRTILVNHRWISTPKLTILGVRIPIESVSDKILKKFNQQIVDAIDSSLMQSLDVPALKSKARIFFNQPVFTYDTTVLFYVQPLKFSVHALRNEGDHIIIPVGVSINALCSDLRTLQVGDSLQIGFDNFWKQESDFNMQIHLSQTYLNRLIKASVEGQQFGSGVTKVVVHKVDYHGYYREIGVRLTCSGAYKGDMEIRFVPAFDNTRNKIYLENLVLLPQTTHSLSKTLMDVFRALAENQLKKSMEKSFNELLQEYQIMVLDLLNTKYMENQLQLEGDIIDFEISDFVSDHQQCVFNLKARLNLNAKILQINR